MRHSGVTKWCCSLAVAPPAGGEVAHSASAAERGAHHIAALRTTAAVKKRPDATVTSGGHSTAACGVRCGKGGRRSATHSVCYASGPPPRTNALQRRCRLLVCHAAGLAALCGARVLQQLYGFHRLRHGPRTSRVMTNDTVPAATASCWNTRPSRLMPWGVG